MAYTGEEIALAFKGARWCGWVLDDDGWHGDPIDDLQQWVWDDGTLSDQTASALLFAVLLDKCEESGIEVHSNATPILGGTRFAVGRRGNEDGVACDKNRTLALLLALDAAGFLGDKP